MNFCTLIKHFARKLPNEALIPFSLPDASILVNNFLKIKLASSSYCHPKGRAHCHIDKHEKIGECHGENEEEKKSINESKQIVKWNAACAKRDLFCS
ncbi:CLUMA_CG016684, isoform A [Clunio marinus]|uniref:CLUMA_CG016684, isoform A n=1 Tax=Clunio marinus TaxID=568069 RepID=A0A1J1IU36_9DIPT|nr:CLUMA_CG016684, isoform A [Clunio marinus]